MWRERSPIKTAIIASLTGALSLSGCPDLMINIEKGDEIGVYEKLPKNLQRGFGTLGMEVFRGLAAGCDEVVATSLNDNNEKPLSPGETLVELSCVVKEKEPALKHFPIGKDKNIQKF